LLIGSGPFRHNLCIDGVTPRPIPSCNAIEGIHQIVIEGTKLCLNMTRNLTESGRGIIPYPCSGGFSNMVFNLVDQGAGFYSIQTLNGSQQSVPDHLE
jgi:hypothetical protein